ncbi:MAG: rod shape-determining protein MreC [Candidatus Omnitrophota bacterium]
MHRKYHKIFVYFLIFLAAFFLLFAPQKIFTPFKLQLASLPSAIVRAISFPFRELKKILYYHRTFEEYKKLKSENSALKSRLVGLEEVLRENNRLERLLNFKRKLIFSSVMANVIGRDPTNWNASILIDKGEEDGISENMPVVNAMGVVGKVAEVNKTKSRVILLNDPQFSVVALIQRTREIGLLSGTLKGTCRLRYLSPDSDAQIGDKVITSKLSSSFPEGLLIGEITGINSQRGQSEVEYIVQPTVSFSGVEEVLVVQK